MKLSPRKPVNTESNVGKGIEFALGIAIFLGLGYLLDSWFNTKPVFMIIMFFIGVIGMFASLWYRYVESMAQHDQQRTSQNHQHHSPTEPVETKNPMERGTA